MFWPEGGTGLVFKFFFGAHLPLREPPNSVGELFGPKNLNNFFLHLASEKKKKNFIYYF